MSSSVESNDPPNFSGIVVDFSESEDGYGEEELMPVEKSEPTPEPVPDPEPVKAKPVKAAPAKPQPKKKSAPAVKTPVKTNTIVAETEAAIAAKKAKEKKRKELEAQRAADAEQKKLLAEQARAKAAEEAKAEAERQAAAKKAAEAAAKKAAYEARKNRFGGALSKGSNKAKPNGHTGDPSGTPNAAALKGLSVGKSNVGDGLGARKIVFAPNITDNSQKTGKVVVKLCVDASGKVIDAKYTQKGSTTTDTELIALAVSSVKQYKFTSSKSTEQCGSISIDFKLR